MPPQNHVVLHEIAEVTILDTGYAREVHETFGRVLREVAPALIQESCDAAAPPEVIHRLARIEVDLGRVPLTGLATALAGALRTTLPASLATAIRQTEGEAGGRQTTRSISQLELVERFLRTGALPWWADRTKADSLVETLHSLCQETPRELDASLRRWAQNLPALRRLVRACADDDLRGLVRILQPTAAGALGALPGAVRVLIEEGTLCLAAPAVQVRHEVWQSVLGVAAAPGVPAEPRALLREAIQRLGVILDVPASTLSDALACQRELEELLEPARSGPGSGDDLPGPPTWLVDPAPPLAGLLAAVEPWLVRGPASLRAELNALLASSAPGASPPSNELRRWLRAALASGALPREPLQVWLAQFGQDSPPSAPALLAAVEAALDTPRSRPPQEEERKPSPGASFHEADALSIDNAGLVILWPFLAHFFTHLGLVVEQQFVNDWAPHRAATLLQFLLTTERIPPLEYLLPLNKILCGLAPDALFEPGAPVTDEEDAECERLLTAVIEQAPILRRMSLPGFRGTFLARRGQLGTRDGSWLLRVERATYDVVLDRFPWSFQWVRLPWMSAPMFVEW